MRWCLALSCVWVACAGAAEGPATRGRSARADQCVGETIETGLDANNDHKLDDTEVTAATVLCQPTPKAGCTGRVLTGPVEISSPEDEDKLTNIDCIDGDVIIVSNDAFDVRGLDGVTITGNLAIAGDPNMASLDGLAKVKRVGGTLLLQGNDALADLSALASVPAGELAIVANDHLPDLAGLELLSATDLTITRNHELASLQGLEQLTSVHRLTIRDNALTDLAPLHALASADRVDISDESRLPNLELPSLAFAGDVVIENDGGLASLSLPVLAVAHGTLTLDGDTALGSATAPSLQQLGGLEVRGAPQLATLDVHGVSEAASGITLHQVGLTSLDGLRGLASTGSLAIESCDQLASLTALAELKTVIGDLTITGNAKLKQEDIDSFVKRVHVGGTTKLDH